MSLYQTCNAEGFATSNWIETELDIEGIEALLGAEVCDGDGELLFLFDDNGKQVAWIKE